MPSIQKLLFEAVVVGLLMIPVTYLAAFFAKRLVDKPTLPEICSTWNKYYIMELNLFIAGFLFHLLSEWSGLNKYYVQNYR